MQTFDGLAADLLRGGRGGQLRALAASRDGEKLAGMVDASAIERAAASGDADALRGLLARVLSTDEGRRLAGEIRRVMED